MVRITIEIDNDKKGEIEKAREILDLFESDMEDLDDEEFLEGEDEVMGNDTEDEDLDDEKDEDN